MLVSHHRPKELGPDAPVQFWGLVQKDSHQYNSYIHFGDLIV
jgi:hypothetical protein